MSFLCVGQMVADILVNPLNQVDYALDTQKVDFIKLKSGGDSLNVATALAKLNQAVSFVGKCGQDHFGDFLCHTATANRVDMSGVKRDKNVDTAAVIVALNRAGERAFFYYGAANDRFSVADIDLTTLANHKIVYVGGTFSLTDFDGHGAGQLFLAAKRTGLITALDVTWDVTGRWLTVLAPCLSHLDYFFPSLYEAKEITGQSALPDIAAFLLGKGVKNVVIKMGASGCFVCNNNESFMLPAFPGEVIDTTGAGDCFVAGFLTGLHHQWALRKCAAFGSAVARGCIAAVGATEGVPGYHEALAFIEGEGF